jgi:U3 small nucleolar ribonucleoprotein component
MESLEQYKKLVQKIISKINNRFSTVTFLTVDEIIKEEIDLRSIWWELANMMDVINDKHKTIQQELESLSEEEYDDWGYKIEDEIDDLRHKIDWKVMSLQSLLDTLEKIVSLEEDEELLKYFSDVKPIEL